jgi:hypothetical protein
MMARAITFTQAQIRRAVKAAESAGLRVRKVTIGKDGSITVDGENSPEARRAIRPARHLGRMCDGQTQAEIRKRIHRPHRQATPVFPPGQQTWPASRRSRLR